jgi:hypothetical protein
MRTAEQILISALWVYYILLLVIVILSFIRKRSVTKGAAYEWLILFLLPFSGLLFLKFPIFDAHKTAGLDSFSGEAKAKRQKLYIADIAKDREIISIQDVLAINSVYEKRSVVMDLFSYDSAQYVKELQIALGDPDTEVSHYASAAIVGMKDRLEGKLSATKNDFLNNPSDENAARYLVSIKAYIESGALNENRIRKYEELFCAFMDEWEEEDLLQKQEWFPTLLAYLTHLGHKEKTLALAERFVQETSSQDAYVAALKASYAFRRTEDFRRYLAELRKADLVLTDYHYDILQFFLQNEVRHEK